MLCHRQHSGKVTVAKAATALPVSIRETRHAESAQLLKVFISPSSPPPCCSICVLCYVPLMDQISRAQMLNHKSDLFKIVFIKHYQRVGSLPVIFWSTGRLHLTASDWWPGYRTAAYSRQWSQSRICKGPLPQWGWAAVVWSVPYPGVCQPATADMLLKGIGHTCVESEPPAQSVLIHWKDKLHNHWNVKNIQHMISFPYVSVVTLGTSASTAASTVMTK